MLGQVNISQFKRVYFIGIGGIGMSAIARYFNSKNMPVAGYDKTPSPLTDQLEKEGVAVHFSDLGSDLPSEFLEREATLVVYTPAVPDSMGELRFVKDAGFVVMKRAEVLGLITRDSKALGVAGTHGKTTTSTMLAYILSETTLKCNAFLGGIATNFESNFVSSPESEITVIEADEFDRSFLQLSPFASIVTSTDADHLDIYGDENVFLEGFQKYVELINPEGVLVRHVDADVAREGAITYAVGKQADYVGKNLRFENGCFFFDLETPNNEWKSVELGIPGVHNAENAIACIVLCLELGVSEADIRSALASFKGVKRRFEYHVRRDDLVYIDDYAHHPTEISALINSIELLYPNKKKIGVFQPHLYSRTRDFFDGFSEELSRLDEVILMPIYPARELPIEGVTSDRLLSEISSDQKVLLTPDEIIDRVGEYKKGVVMTIGAGDIDRIVPKLKERLLEG